MRLHILFFVSQATPSSEPERRRGTRPVFVCQKLEPDGRGGQVALARFARGFSQQPAASQPVGRSAGGPGVGLALQQTITVLETVGKLRPTPGTGWSTDRPSGWTTGHPIGLGFLGIHMFKFPRALNN